MQARSRRFAGVDGGIPSSGLPSDSRPAGDGLNVDGAIQIISATAGEHLHLLAAAFDLMRSSGWRGTPTIC
jgi:hypothetical protein